MMQGNAAGLGRGRPYNRQADVLVWRDENFLIILPLTDSARDWLLDMFAVEQRLDFVHSLRIHDDDEGVGMLQEMEKDGLIISYGE